MHKYYYKIIFILYKKRLKEASVAKLQASQGDAFLSPPRKKKKKALLWSYKFYMAPRNPVEREREPPSGLW